MRNVKTFTMVLTPNDLAIIKSILAEGEYRDFSAFMTDAIQYNLQQPSIYSALPDRPHKIKSISLQKDLKKQIDQKVTNNEYLTVGEFLRDAIRVYLHALHQPIPTQAEPLEPSIIQVNDHLKYHKVEKVIQ